MDRVNSDVTAAKSENPNTPVPIDLVTTSGSGLEPDITPAAALFQVPRIARARRLNEDQVRAIVEQHVQPRQFGILGEPRFNVLELNLALDEIARKVKRVRNHATPQFPYQSRAARQPRTSP